MSKRVSMKGMGADAFLPSKPQEAEPQDAMPSERQAVTTPKLQDAKAAKMQKVTVYLPLDHLLKLERIRLARLQSGERVDRSALIAEAVDALSEA